MTLHLRLIPSCYTHGSISPNIRWPHAVGNAYMLSTNAYVINEQLMWFDRTDYLITNSIKFNIFLYLFFSFLMPEECLWCYFICLSLHKICITDVTLLICINDMVYVGQYVGPVNKLFSFLGIHVPIYGVWVSVLN